MTPRPWDRKLWGVVLTHRNRMPGERDALLGSLWDLRVNESLACPGEPAHAMLFQTRAAVRAWIHERRNTYWAKRYRPVRVRERVEVV